MASSLLEDLNSIASGRLILDEQYQDVDPGSEEFLKVFHVGNIIDNSRLGKLLAEDTSCYEELEDHGR